MSRTQRVGVTLALLAPLIGVALFLSDGQRERAPKAGGEPRIVEIDQRSADRVLPLLRREAVRSRARELAAFDSRDQPGPPRQTLRLYRHAHRASEPVARRFHRAFARFELGDPTATQIRSTATPAFARDLLRGTALVLDRARPAPPARLMQLELVPLTAGRRRLDAIELVGIIEREGRRDPIALELRRTAVGWRVAGLGF